jgi:PAS domain S-box-containing protein
MQDDSPLRHEPLVKLMTVPLHSFADVHIRWQLPHCLMLSTSDCLGEIQRNVWHTVGISLLALLGAIALSIYAIKAFQDIRERHQTAQSLQNDQQKLERDVAEKTQALRQSEAKLKAIQRIAQVGSWEFDPGKGVVLWSEEIYRIYEADPETPVSMPDQIIQHIHPNDQDCCHQEIVRHIHQAQPFDTDLRIITQTGKTRYIQIKGEPIANGQGDIMQWVGTVADITARKQIEIELQESHNQFQRLVDDIGDKFVVFRHNGKEGILNYLSHGFEAIIGVPRETVIGRSWRDIAQWLPEDIASAHTYIQEMITTEPEFHQSELRFIHPDGGIRTMLVSEHPVRNENGKLLWVEGIAEDITARKQAEHQIQMALAEKEILLHEIHHRVKNNLQLIQSMLHMQQMRISNPEADEVLQITQGRIRAIALAHDLLYASSNLAAIDLAEYLPSLVQQVRSFHDALLKPLSIQSNIASVNVPLKRAIACGLILSELLTNALKYAFPEPTVDGENIITVKVIREPGQDDHIIHLYVQDNGIGLPADFNLEQVNSLGMILVQALTKQLNGSLEFDSQAGTQFHITFSAQ